MMNCNVDRLIAAFARLESPKWMVQIPVATSEALKRYLRLRACRYVAIRIDRHEDVDGVRPAMLVAIVAGAGSWERSKVIDQEELERQLRLWLRHRRPEEFTVCGFGRSETRVVAPSESRSA